MTNTNKERARRFGRVLRAYDTDDTDKGRLTDLLADARHWCDRNQLSYGQHDRIALDHYLTEVIEERRP